MAELIVVTGGACAGKTAVVDALAARGHACLPEAAIEVIEALRVARGNEGQIAWRRANQVAFQRLVTERQHGREVEARRRPEPFVFCDRGAVDGRAYCEQAGVPWPEDLRTLVRPARYAHVFVLSTLASFEPRRESGRVDTRGASIAVGARLEAIYGAHADRVTRLEEMAIEERVRAIEDAIANPR